MVAAGFAVASCLASCTASPTGRSTAAVCLVINGTLFYPTIPASGEHISLQAATRVEHMLMNAEDSRLRDEAGSLQSAITADDEQQMLAIVASLQTDVCGQSRYPPAT